MECGTPERDVAGPPSRRLVLATAAAAAFGLSGCSVRWESDAGDLPLLETQEPPSDSALLLATRASVSSLVDRFSTADPDLSRWITPLTGMHRTQLSRLTRVTAGAGIELTSSANATTGTAPPSDGPQPDHQDVAALTHAELQRVGGGRLPSALSVSTPRRAMLVAIEASRRSAALLLTPSTSLPRGSAPAAPVARALLNAVLPATAGLETITARTPTKQRGRGTATLTWLWSARTDLEAVAGGAQERPAMPLPGPVDGAGAETTAVTLLSAVVTACASQIDPVGEAPAGPQDWLMRLWAHAEADRCRWSGTPQPFPGLRDQNG